jgi:hypothetical protein
MAEELIVPRFHLEMTRHSTLWVSAVAAVVVVDAKEEKEMAEELVLDTYVHHQLRLETMELS